MMGGLHIEMAALRMVGSFLKGSGWRTAIEESGFASSGTAESFLSVGSATKARRAQQVTAYALHSLMKTAYMEQATPDHPCSKEEEENKFQEWCISRSTQCP